MPRIPSIVHLITMSWLRRYGFTSLTGTLVLGGLHAAALTWAALKLRGR